MTIKKDGTDKYYPVIEKGDHLIVEFNYSKKGPEGTVDGDYSETIQFEISNSIKKLELVNEELEKVNLLFGKHCFCRGEAGYYKVNNGVLNVLKTDSTLKIDLSFKIDKTSHKITRIKQMLTI